MNRLKRTLIIGTAEMAVILVLHEILIRHFAGGNMASVLLSAGEHIPRTTLFMVGLFLLIRILIILLPGILLARLGLALMDHFASNPTDGEEGSKSS